MSRTVTALFDNRSDAEAAKAQLAESHIHADNIRIVQNDGAAGGSAGHDGGFWQSLKDIFVSDEDRHTYAEGINRGGYLLSADVDEDQADAAVRILDQANTVDLDERSADWRGSGWSGTFTGAGATSGGQAVDEQAIPVIEEELRVGKREVSRGGARVRSYVREIPVSEQVSLREEHVSVERRPVDRALDAGELTGDLLKDRTIEMTETAEQAVVGKEARVVEEVVVRKTAGTHVETVNDTVRRTEVEVDNDVRGGTANLSGTTTTGTAGGSGTVATGIDGDLARADDRI